MQLDLDNLPSDTALLHRLVRDMAAIVEHRNGEIERLQLLIRQVQRTQYGRSSERLVLTNSRLGWTISTPIWRLPKLVGRRWDNA